MTGPRTAFAKAVSNAMEKPVARLCDEIAKDHADALAGKLHGGPRGYIEDDAQTLLDSQASVK